MYLLGDVLVEQIEGLLGENQVLTLEDVVNGEARVSLDVDVVNVGGGLSQGDGLLFSSNDESTSFFPVESVRKLSDVLGLTFEFGETVDDGEVSLSELGGQSRNHCELSHLRVDLKLPVLRVRTVSSSGTDALSGADGTHTSISGTLLFVNFTR